MIQNPVGTITGDKVVVKGNDAITLYNKGYYGHPEKDKLILNGFEALHLFELGRVDIKDDSRILAENELISYFSGNLPNFVPRYLVYKDLRNRGYVVNQGKGSSFFFRLYERGAVPRKDSAKYYITPLQEGKSIKLTELDNLIDMAEQSSKILVFGMVDAVGDVSYLRVTELVPENREMKKEFSTFTSWSWEKGWEQYLQSD